MGDRKIAYVPESNEVQNETGRFVVYTKSEDGWITLERGLRLEGIIVQPEDWPLLRALLLEEQDSAHRTVILK